MVIEILFSEACNLYGDGQNIQYLQATLPDAEFVFTSLTDAPCFADKEPDMIYIGAMSESVQRRIIEKLIPYRDRICRLIDKGTPILATGNAGEIFCKKIDYVAENLSIDGLGIFDLTVKTNWFDRYNRKFLGKFEGISIVGFRAQFSFIYGDNSGNYFAKCIRGDGINPASKLEGFRKNNLICTQVIGPILPLNPLFCEYFLELAGVKAPAAFREAAMRAYEQRCKEFTALTTVF